MAITYPHTYETFRTIRGMKRKVIVTKFSREQESLKFVHPKPRNLANTRILTRAEARNFQNSRSTKAKVQDARKTVTLTRSARWLKHPDKYDYPQVDSEGRGIRAGEGRQAGRKLRHKK